MLTGRGKNEQFRYKRYASAESHITRLSVCWGSMMCVCACASACVRVCVRVRAWAVVNFTFQSLLLWLHSLNFYISSTF